MPEGRRSSLLRRVALEVAVWYGLVGAFLVVYVGNIGAPSASIVPHLRIVTDAVVVLAFARLALAAFGLPPALFRFISSLLFSLAVAALLLYYAAALVGLKSWGRVTTWELFASYAPQLSLFLDAMGIPLAAGLAVAVLGSAAIVWVGWLHARRWDWVSIAASKVSRVPLAVGASAVVLIAALDLHLFMFLPPVLQQEPVSLSLYPADGALGIQTLRVDRAAAARRDAAEDAVRAAYRPGNEAARRNVILIVADALRADHMGVYGYPRDTTPNLSRLYSGGQARLAPILHSACGESSCGLLSLASARYVHQFGGRMFLLHEVLARHGYRIAMILGGDHTHFYGLKQQYGGFDSYFDGSEANAGYMNDDRVVLDHLAAMPDWDGRPVAMQFHLMSPHILGKRHPSSTVFLPAATYFISGNRVEGESKAPSRKAINFYDNGVRQTDDVIREILETLRRKGYLGNAVVAVTADHGEGLGEHGLWLHQEGVYREMLGIPLVLIAYGYRPQQTLAAHALPSQVDIAPTLLHDLGMPVPSAWAGRPLQGDKLDEFAYFQQGPLVGLLDRRDPRNQWKYWEDRRDGAAFAFNLSDDPAEARNAISAVPDALRREWRLKILPINAQYVAKAAWE